jgi:arsenate reductase
MKKILVICTGNACRSQIAHGFLNDLAKDQYEIFSAGTHPTRVHPAAIKVMNEIDIDISTHTSDPIDDYIDKGIDIVITVCDSANKLCPTFPGEVERIHWSISDPYINWSDEEQFLPTYRNARNIIQEKIESFLNEKRPIN